MSTIQIQKLPPTTPKSPNIQEQIIWTEVIRDLRNDIYHHLYNEVTIKFSDEILSKVIAEQKQRILVQLEAILQKENKIDNLTKSDPIMDELLKESEDSLTRVWDNKYDDEWD